MELCAADHDGDPASVDAWLANMTPEWVRSWLGANPAGTVVALDLDASPGSDACFRVGWSR